MKRRDFGRIMALGTVGSTVFPAKAVHSKPKKSLMHVGAQYMGTSFKELQFLKRHGVNNMDGPTCNWKLDEMLKAKEKCAKYGISLDMVHVNIGRNIVLGKSPERDREIEILSERIKIASKVGLRGLNYNFTILPLMRTEPTPGRGGTTYSTWVLDKAKDTSITEAGRVSLEEFFERIAYFLERVIPVAAEYRVQMACHLPDPPTPPGFRGIDRWNYTVDGLKRFVTIAESSYHGFNLCCGTLAESLKDPGKEIYDIVKYFGKRKKIFNVHFRNIRGGLNNFLEVYPDEGDVDMYKLAKVFKEVEYPYMLMPDHAPKHPDEVGSGRVRHAWAFQFGYIKALIQAVNSEA